MRRVDAQLTLIHCVSYDPLTGTLEVQFQDGNAYRFYEVEPEVYEELLDAPSKGQYFNEYRSGALPLVSWTASEIEALAAA